MRRGNKKFAADERLHLTQIAQIDRVVVWRDFNWEASFKEVKMAHAETRRRGEGEEKEA
jgi:hypothetical protein